MIVPYGPGRRARIMTFDEIDCPAVEETPYEVGNP